MFCNIFMTVAILMMSPASTSAMFNDDIPNSLPQYFSQGRDQVCSGLGMGLSFSGNSRHWYNIMQTRYAGCTYVDGNLIITWLEDPNVPFDFSFLRNIRYVRGYVLIAVVDYRVDLPLLNLEVIRGNETFEYGGQNHSLAIFLTNFTNIRMPNLKEISKGDVIIDHNRQDLRVDLTKGWDDIMAGRVSSNPDSLRIQDGVMTSEFQSPDICSPLCPRRCFSPGAMGCCHSQCAGGCRGPRRTDCEVCKDFTLHGRVCVSHCPLDNFPNYRPSGRYCRP